MAVLAFISHCAVATCLHIHPQEGTACFLRALTKMNMPLYSQDTGYVIGLSAYLLNE